jgi:hypothetical protein
MSANINTSVKQSNKVAINLNHKEKSQLWQLIISVDFDYSRITIAEHELEDNSIVLYLEDKEDFKNTLDECVCLNIPLKNFARVIKAEGLNSYEATKLHASKKYTYTERVEIAPPIKWYEREATTTERAWAREALLKAVMTHLVESEVASA